MREALHFEDLTPEEKEQRGILGRLYGNVASFAAPTRNGRKYDQSLWEQLFDSDLIKERFANGGIFGQLNHPEYEEVNMQEIACVMPEPPVKDDKGRALLENGVNNGTPSAMLFEVEDSLFDLLKKAEYIEDVEIWPVPRNAAYTAQQGETLVDNETIRDHILSKCVTIEE